MDRGTILSGVGHVGLILWVALGEWLFAPAELPAPSVAEVSLISSAEFDKLAAAQPTTPKPAPEAKPAKPEVATPDPVTPDLPPAEALPEVTPPEQPSEAPPDAPVSDDPQPVEAPPPDSPVAEQAQPIPVPVTSVRPKPRPIDRVAPTPVETPVQTPEIADQATPEVTDQPAPDAPVVTEDQPAAAPQEATTQIVTEAVETDTTAPQLAPTSSRRPQSRPVKVAEIPVEQPAKPAPEKPSPQTDTTSIDAALAAATADAPAETSAEATSQTADQNAPQGPPMTGGEKDALRVAVKQCWNIGSLSSEALRITVTLRVDVAQSGVPDAGSIRMTGFEGGTEAGARMMFEVARRAIIRCGKNGFPLPPEKYDSWKDLELVFDPNGMRMR